MKNIVSKKNLEKRKRDRSDYINKFGMKKCYNCSGNGEVWREHKFPDMRGSQQFCCPVCLGSGKIYWTKEIIRR